LRRVAARVLDHEGLQPDARVALFLVDEPRMADLNRRFHGKEGPTDVLSFPLRTEGFPLPPGEPPHLGDVVVCGPVAARQAQEYGHALEREIGYLFAHGLLHLLGYDHQRPDEQAEMREREERALAAVGLTR
jgi:probable rRNA maturation factor